MTIEKTPLDELQQCIQDCLDVSRVCMETLSYCHEQGGHLADPVQLATLLDCAEISQLSAHFMLRNSQFYPQTCAVCADVCQDCVADCLEFDADAKMSQCAEICRRCAESCQVMMED